MGIETASRYESGEDAVRIMHLKNFIQLGLMHYYGIEHNENEKAAKWIDDFSSKFNNIFQRRIETEKDFLDRCDKESLVVIEEIAGELGSAK